MEGQDPNRGVGSSSAPPSQPGLVPGSTGQPSQFVPPPPVAPVVILVPVIPRMPTLDTTTFASTYPAWQTVGQLVQFYATTSSWGPGGSTWGAYSRSHPQEQRRDHQQQPPGSRSQGSSRRLAPREKDQKIGRFDGHCHNCGKKGHIKRVCRFPGGGAYKQHHQNDQSPDNQPTRPQTSQEPNCSPLR